MSRCRHLLVLIGAFAILPLSAQTPTACYGKFVPLKPALMSCQEAAPACVTDATGLNGRWIWGCPSGTNSAAPLAGGGFAILSPPAPAVQFESPLDTMIRAQQLRNLQLQNQQMRQQMNAPAMSPPPVVHSVPTPPSGANPTSETDFSRMITMDHPNGRMWNSWTPPMRLVYLLGMHEALGPLLSADVPKPEVPVYFPRALNLSETLTALDQFYAEPANLPIPIFAGMSIVTLEANGAAREKIDSELSIARRISSVGK
jgi:hypothetical protein